MKSPPWRAFSSSARLSVSSKSDRGCFARRVGLSSPTWTRRHGLKRDAIRMNRRRPLGCCFETDWGTQGPLQTDRAAFDPLSDIRAQIV